MAEVADDDRGGEDFDFEDDRDPGSPYEDPASIAPDALRTALTSLELFGDDPSLSMQATNLALSDQFIMALEGRVIGAVREQGRPDGAEGALLLALSQMWIFAAYEVLRTWRQRATEAIKLADSGQLAQQAAELEKDQGFRNYGREVRADQWRTLNASPERIDRLKADVRLCHMPFVHVEMLRMPLAHYPDAGHRHRHSRRAMPVSGSKSARWFRRGKGSTARR